MSWSERIAALALITVAAVSTVTGALVIPTRILAVTLLVSLVVIGPLVAVVLTGHGRRAATAARAGAQAGAATIVGVIALTGAGALLGAATAPLLVLLGLLLAGWAWIRHSHPPLSSDTEPGPGEDSPVATGPASPAVAASPSALPMVAAASAGASVAELCRAWQRSYWLLLEMPDGAHRTEMVELRRHLLDELEARDPAGFHRWLDTGPRAGGDPRRHLDIT